MQTTDTNSVLPRDKRHQLHVNRAFVARVLADAHGTDFLSQPRNCVLLGPNTEELKTLAAALRGFRVPNLERKPAIGRVWVNRLPSRSFVWPDIVAIAGWGFDATLVREAVVRYGKSVHYVDAGYLDRLVFNRAAWSEDEIEHRRRQSLSMGHPGLRLVARARTFDDWPTLESAVHHTERQGADATGERFENRNSRSFLRDAGYRVGKTNGLPPFKRQRILEEQVARRGLEEVASFLAWLVEDSSCRKNMEVANAHRRADLRYLRQEHWDDAFGWSYPNP